MATGWLYDGATATRHAVAVSADGERILLAFVDGAEQSLDPDELAAVAEAAGPLFTRPAVDGWRLGLDEAPDPMLAALLPAAHRCGGWIDRFGLWRAAGVALALSAVVVAVGYTAPQWLAPLVPMSWEKRYGDALVGDFGGNFCQGPGGVRALDRLARRLAPEGGYDIRVVDVPVVNAAALPGGHIMVFRKLIDEAQSPDELAGVVAHEIAHVKERHVMAAMIRQYGVGMVLAGFGGQAGTNIDGIVSLGYSRSAESEADDDAVATLRRAGISPLPTAEFFKRLPDPGGNLGEAIAYVSSHPASGGRRSKFAGSFVKETPYRPALAASDWAAVRAICGTNPAD